MSNLKASDIFIGIDMACGNNFSEIAVIKAEHKKLIHYEKFKEQSVFRFFQKIWDLNNYFKPKEIWIDSPYRLTYDFKGLLFSSYTETRNLPLREYGARTSSKPIKEALIIALETHEIDLGDFGRAASRDNQLALELAWYGLNIPRYTIPLEIINN